MLVSFFAQKSKLRLKDARGLNQPLGLYRNFDKTLEMTNEYYTTPNDLRPHSVCLIHRPQKVNCLKEEWIRFSVLISAYLVLFPLIYSDLVDLVLDPN